jgi:4-amino-4-deoxy-L-arabinose transferase-like glycosyltransferase
MALVVLAAIALRLLGLNWGLPDVLEEATPFREAFDMWGWHPRTPVDLNPHFFNYPSLVIYIQFLVNGAAFLVMRAAGSVADGTGFLVMEIANPGGMVLAARLVGVAFAVATVLALYRLGRRAAGRDAGVVAAGLLAINLYHVDRSRMIEVDVPLTFFVAAALIAILGVIDSPTRRRYLLAGLAVGLAASVKYTGALLALPLLAAHLLARRAHPGRGGWTELLPAGVAAVLAFVFTSPYVLLDFTSFREALATEGHHMRLGHFGLGDDPALVFYLRALGERVLGWPALLAGLAGLGWRAARRRDGWALVLGTWVIVYGAAISSWSMMADRYALPLAPLLLAGAVAGVVDVAGAMARRAGRPGAENLARSVLFAILALSMLAGLPAHRRMAAPDARSLAREWIESAIPAGSMIAVEAHGPMLLGPVDYWLRPPDVIAGIETLERRRYAVQPIPMYQVLPERAGAFYDLSLYKIVDGIVVTDAVRSRYRGEPQRFARQMAFYDSLDASWPKVADFVSPAGGGRVTLYQNPAHLVPFAAREEAADPPPLRHETNATVVSGARFYFDLGVNYEAFGHPRQAVESYKLVFEQPAISNELFPRAAFAAVGVYMDVGRPDVALSFLDSIEARADTPARRQQLQRLRDIIARSR